MNPLVHADEAEAGPCRMRGVEAAPVVPNAEDGRVASFELDTNRLRVPVPRRIRHGFARDPQERLSQLLPGANPGIDVERQSGTFTRGDGLRRLDDGGG